VAIIFACQGSQYPIYGWQQQIANKVTQDAKPNIIDALLMLIFRIGQ